MSDYKDSLNLPQTDFSMKANLSQQEPKRLDVWESQGLYQQIREARAGQPQFILHDGPPYANGHLHCGHALNKILKDIVIKSKTMGGFDAPFVPGWDCHGLPIEINVEKKLGKVGHKVNATEFRAACRAYASSQIDIQRQEFKRLGVFGSWEQPYATMDFNYEAAVVRSVGQLIEKGLVYQGFKPVHWCFECGSALAEAEVDYEDKTSPAIDVAFPAVDAGVWLQLFGVQAPADKPVWVPIWTTTPWTLPANEAVCLNPAVQYGLYETPAAYLVLAVELASAALTRYGFPVAPPKAVCLGEALARQQCQHPFLAKHVPVVLGPHVTVEAGTGCVHTAPAHGVDDHEVGRTWDLAWSPVVLPNGCYAENVPFFAGMFVLKANDAVIEKLRETHTLLANEPCLHSYPHCWRHKTPMIFLATPQWFISMDKTGLRDALLKALPEIHFIPEWGTVRMRNMIASRPDWCISRQRSWGTPITVWIHKQTRVLHPKTTEFIPKIAELIAKKGIEAWFEVETADYLGEEAAQYEKVTDTLDVWFDAGLSHAGVLAVRPELRFPADLYLEGSDQYRGWFNASLTTATALGLESPYKMVLTHGYTVDAHGKKLSKSQGNYIDLDKLIHQHGADLIRLWVSSTDYRHEVSVSDEILKRLADSYRRIRNTARFLLANLCDFDPKRHLVDIEKCLELDVYMLAKAQQLQASIIDAYEAYQFHVVYQKVHHFCSIDLGSFYLDIIKDRQYTTGKDSLARRSCQTVMYWILTALVRWVAPIIPFTADEIWSFLPGEQEKSVFLTTWELAWPVASGVNEEKWAQLQAVRDEVNRALEIARDAKLVGSGLAAEVVLYLSAPLLALVTSLEAELRFFFITSGASALPFSEAPKDIYRSTVLEMAVDVRPSTHEKCARCWHRVADIGVSAEHPDLCGRCVQTIDGQAEERLYV